MTDIIGTEGPDTLSGLAGPDQIQGLGGDDRIFAGNGDSVDGGTGFDRLNISFLDSTRGVVADFRISPYVATPTFTIEGAVITRVEAIESIEGSEFDDFLTVAQNSVDFAPIYGRGGNDQIWGGSRTGSLFGGDGNDVFSLRESGLNADHFGEAGNDWMVGGPADDGLFGGEGNDWLSGNGGIDTYSGGQGTDTVDFSRESGPVIVNLSETLSLSPYPRGGRLLAPGEALVGSGQYETLSSIENLRLTVADDSALGNDGANLLEGGGGDDRLDGGGGADRLVGGLGNDRYTIDAGDIVTEAADAGIDTVLTPLADTTAPANVENLIGLLNTGQILRGNALNNAIAGGAGADSMLGGLGDDIYTVGAGDSVTELAGGGTDEVRTALAAYSLVAEVERLIGTSATGQTLNGNSLANFISGGAGADTMAGGLDNDVYVAGAGDNVVELAGEGNDEVRTAAASFRLAANIETLTGTSSGGQALNGNALANTITGGAGNDVLNGESGADTMAGGLGDDRYYITEGDVVTEGANAGVDEVRTTLADTTAPDNVENLTGILNTGQILRGNALNNVIAGGTGADAMLGGIGNDSYVVGAGDSVTELAGEGTDTVKTALAAYTLGVELENLIGTSAAGQALNGNALDNGIAGGAGADTFAGGLGDDYYSVGAGDSVVELVGEGDDEVQTSLASYTLAANVERLTGSGHDQVLTGNDLANTLEGLRGADQLNGAGGDDIFVYQTGKDWTGDRIDGGSGFDTMLLDGELGGSNGDTPIVFQAGSLTSVELILLATGPAGTNKDYKLTFAGGTFAVGTGILIDGSALKNTERLDVDASLENAGSFTIYGGEFSDRLTGGDQADVIRGGGGADRLNGGGGADRFVYTSAAQSTGGSMDHIIGFDYRVDTIDLPVSVSGWAPRVIGGHLSSGPSFDEDLAAAVDAALGPNQAIRFDPSSGSFPNYYAFVVIDANGDGNYQAGQDYVFIFEDPAVFIAPVTDFFV